MFSKRVLETMGTRRRARTGSSLREPPDQVVEEVSADGVPSEYVKVKPRMKAEPTLDRFGRGRESAVDQQVDVERLRGFPIGYLEEGLELRTPVRGTRRVVRKATVGPQPSGGQPLVRGKCHHSLEETQVDTYHVGDSPHELQSGVRALRPGSAARVDTPSLPNPLDGGLAES
ncbi:MAG: hypothetical protein ABSA63_04270 [Thermoplasmata archaeon]|jgi:hypothetical protein